MTQEQSQSITEIETEALSIELYDLWRKSFAEIAAKCTTGKQIYEVGGMALANLTCCYMVCSTTTSEQHPIILAQLLKATQMLLDSVNTQDEIHKLLN